MLKRRTDLLARALLIALAAIMAAGAVWSALFAFSRSEGENASISPDWASARESAGATELKLKLAVQLEPANPQTPAELLQAEEYKQSIEKLSEADAAAAKLWNDAADKLSKALKAEERHVCADANGGAVASVPDMSELSLLIKSGELKPDGCAVSEAYAKANGLALGSELELSLLPAKISWSISESDYEYSWGVEPIGEKAVKTSLTVTAVYADAEPADEYAFPADTVYVSASALADLPKAESGERLPGALLVFHGGAEALDESDRSLLRINGQRYEGVKAEVRPIPLAAAAALALLAALFAVAAIKLKPRAEAGGGVKGGFRTALACFFKRAVRRGGQSAASVLMLAAAGVLLCTGTGLLYIAQSKRAEAESAYTATVGLNLQTAQKESGLADDAAANKAYSANLAKYQQICKKILNIAGKDGESLLYTRKDDRRNYTADSESARSATTWEADSENNSPPTDYNALASVLVARCVGIAHDEEYEKEEEAMYAGLEGMESELHYYLYVTWETEEVLAKNRGLEASKYSVSLISVPRVGAETELAVGERYILSSYIAKPGYYARQEELAAFTPDGSVPDLLLFLAYSAPDTIRTALTFADISSMAENAETYKDDASAADWLTIEALGGKSAEGFLAANEVWRSAIDSVSVKANGFEILTTDNVKSVQAFQQGESSVIAGREFSREEYAQGGAKACLVSEAFARVNGLAVGDKLNINMYSSTYFWSFGGEAGRDPLNGVWYLYPESSAPLGTESFEVVGIYSSTGWGRGEQDININTVIVPAQSLVGYPPTTESYYGYPQLDYALLLDNGDIEAVRAELDASAFGKYFTLEDQGYTQSAAAIGNLTKYGIGMFAVAAAVWAAVVVMFAQGYVGGGRRTASSLRAFGAGRGAVTLAQTAVCAVMALMAGAIAWAVSSAALGSVTEAVRKLSLVGTELTNAEASGINAGAAGASLLISAAAQAAAILIISLFAAARNSAGANLMSGKADKQ